MAADCIGENYEIAKVMLEDVRVVLVGHTLYH
jgi:hypothetical protein